MDIRHAMIVRNNKPDRLFAALTQQSELEVWMGAPTLARPEIGATLEFQFDQGRRTLKLEVIDLEAGKQVHCGRQNCGTLGRSGRARCAATSRRLMIEGNESECFAR